MDNADDLTRLIEEGEQLAPQGGNSFEGYNGKSQPEYVSWRLQALAVIQELGNAAAPILKDLEQDKQGPYFYKSSASRVLGALKAAAALSKRASPSVPVSRSHQNPNAKLSRKVFIVHGHDRALLEQTARFLAKLELEPIILFEEANRGQTIMEKLEANSDVPVAIVLLTPDDLGRGAKEDELKPRARQNVVLELGYFIGKLTRRMVVALYDESVELPSDYRGVGYIPVDAAGAWKLRLAKELKDAGLKLDLNSAI